MQIDIEKILHTLFLTLLRGSQRSILTPSLPKSKYVSKQNVYRYRIITDQERVIQVFDTSTPLKRAYDHRNFHGD